MPDIFDELDKPKSDIFDQMAPTSDRSRTDIFDQVQGSGDIFDRAGPIPRGNVVTDVAKGVARGWEHGIGELGGVMSAGGDQVVEAFTGDTYKDETGRVWTRTPTQKKVAEAMVKLGSFFKNYGKEVQTFYRENADKGWEAPDPSIMFGWKHPIRKAVTLAAEGAPKMAIAGVVTAATKNPVAGASVFAPGAYEQIYHEARDAGKSPEEAAKLATLNAAAQTGLGVVPLGQWMRGANIAKRILTTSLSAGIVQSGGGTAIQNGIRATGIEKPKTVEEFKNIMLDGMAESMVAGILTGGVLGAFHPTSMADRISEKVDNWAGKNLDKFAKENSISKPEAQKIVEAAKTEIINQAKGISKEISADPMASMPKEEPIPPAPIKIPEFRNTEEAVKYGWENKDNPAVLEALRKNREEIQAKYRELNAKENPTPAEEQEAFRLAQIAQFPREALEGAAGKIKLTSKEDMFDKIGAKKEPLASAEKDAGLPPESEINKMAAGDKENFKMFEEVYNLKKEFAARVGERYVKPGSIGTYYPAEQSIRTRAMNDLFTTAHEMFHYISDTRKTMGKIYTPMEGSKVGHPIYDKEFHGIRKEIAQIYFDLYGAPSKSASMRVAMEEGGAMLIETYIKDPEFMQKKYPMAVKEFLMPGGKFYDPHVGDFVQKARGIYERYLQQDPLGRILSRVTDKEFASDRGSFLNLRDRLIETFFDSYYLTEKLGKEAGVHMTLKDPQVWFRLNSMMKHLAYGNIEQGRGFWTINYKTGALEKISERNWGDLINDLNKKGILDKFSGWLIARDQYFEYQKLDQLRSDAMSEINPGKRNQLIKDYQEQLMYLKRNNWNRKDIEAAYADYRDQFQKYGDEFNQYTRNGLKMMAQAGLITPQQYAEMVVKESYAPMKRQIYDDILGPESDRIGAIKVGGTKISSMLRRTGGMQTIVNPMYQAIIDMGEIYNKTMKQRAVNSVLNLAPQFPDFFHRLQLTTLIDKETGRVTYPQERDNNIMMMRVNGKRVPYLVDHDIKAFIENYMTPVQISVMEKMGNFTARLFTKGTTSLYPFFAFNNFIQDQVFALGNTRTKLVPVLDAAKVLHQALMQKDPEIARLWERYNLMGGQYMTMMQNIRAMTPEDFFHFVTKEKNAIEKVTEGVDKFMDVLAMPVQASELMTRFVEFVKAVKAGDPEIVALEKAGRVSGPFHHKGTWGGRGYRFLVDQIPYFNAGMQILGEQSESLTSSDPVRRQRAQFVALSVGALMIGSMVNAYRNGSEDQKRLLRDLNAQEQSKYLFMPDPNGKDLIRIRVPDMTGSAAGIINMILLGMMDDKSRYDVGDFANAATAFVPDQLNPLSGPRLLFAWLPQIIKPAVELATNTRTFPNLRPIESEGMQYREPKFRVYPTTSQMAKDIGKNLNLSPIKVDYLIQGYLGRVTKIPTWVYEQATGGKAKFNFDPFVRRWYFESSQVLQDYYNKKRDVNQKYNTLRHKFETLSPQDAREIQMDHQKVLRIDRLMDDYSKHTKETELLREDQITQSKQHWIETQRARILKEIEQLLDPSPVERGEE